MQSAGFALMTGLAAIHRPCAVRTYEVSGGDVGTAYSNMINAAHPWSARPGGLAYPRVGTNHGFWHGWCSSKNLNDPRLPQRGRVS
jgi:hypothetical protein